MSGTKAPRLTALGSSYSQTKCIGEAMALYSQQRGITPRVARNENIRILDRAQTVAHFPKSATYDHHAPIGALMLPYTHSYAVARIFYALKDTGHAGAPAELAERKHLDKFLMTGGEPPRVYKPTTGGRKVGTTGPLHIVEGPFKAIAAAAKGLKNVVGIAGCWNGRLTDRDIEQLHPGIARHLAPKREVVIQLDADVRSNLQVARALIRMFDLLTEAGAVPVTRFLPDAGDANTGLDDYLVAHTIKDYNALPSYGADAPEIRKLRALCEPINEFGVANRLALLHRDDLRHDPKRDEWYVYADGWRAASKEPYQLAKSIIERLKDDALLEHDDKAQAARLKAAATLQRDHTIKAALSAASADARLAVDAGSFDTNPRYIGVQNGILDLETRSLLKPTRDLMVTKTMGCAYDLRARAPLFDSFINTATGGNRDLRRHVQEIVGAALLGRADRSEVIFWYGEGGNGKTVLLEIAHDLLGDYATPAKAKLILMERRDADSERPTPFLINLRGKRLATCSELPERVPLDVTVIKDLAGGDTITARTLHKDPVEFRNTARIWIRCNYAPEINATDDGTWDRIAIVPFTHRVPDAERDPDLRRKIAASELPGVLNFAIEGMRRYVARNYRLDPPASCKAEVAKLRVESDVLGAWIEQCIEIVKDRAIKELQPEVYKHYKEWCADNGFHDKSAKSFWKDMRRRLGYDPIVPDGKRWWAEGIRIVRSEGGQTLLDCIKRERDKALATVEELRGNKPAAAPKANKVTDLAAERAKRGR